MISTPVAALMTFVYIFVCVAPFLFLAGCVVYTVWTQGWLIIFAAIWLAFALLSAKYAPKKF